jgi:hypothetical protein
VTFRRLISFWRRAGFRGCVRTPSSPQTDRENVIMMTVLHRRNSEGSSAEGAFYTCPGRTGVPGERFLARWGGEALGERSPDTKRAESPPYRGVTIGRAFSPLSSLRTLHGASPHAGIGRAVGARNHARFLRTVLTHTLQPRVFCKYHRGQSFATSAYPAKAQARKSSCSCVPLVIRSLQHVREPMAKAFPMKVYPRGKDVEVVFPKENDLFSRSGRAQHHGKCSKATSEVQSDSVA